jgi:hypothetical protein
MLTGKMLEWGADAGWTGITEPYRASKISVG